MKTYSISFFVALLFLIKTASATHSLSADISYNYLGGPDFLIRVTYFMDMGTPADREQISVYYSDGTMDTFPRISEELLPDDISKNIYEGVHTFTSVMPITITMSDPNFIGNIVNVSGSVNVPIIVSTTIDFPTLIVLGTNASPVFTDVPVDYAEVGEVFTHNTEFIEADGDELKFSLVDADLPAYEFPDEMFPPCDGSPGIFNIDESTGIITWDFPCDVGIYLAEIKIEELRDGYVLSTIYRYFVIKVDETGPTQINNDLIETLAVYPNPATDKLIVTLQPEAEYLNIFNATGNKVITVDCRNLSGDLQITVGDLPSGNYFIQSINKTSITSEHIIIN